MSKSVLIIISAFGLTGSILPYDPLSTLHIPHLDKAAHLIASGLLTYTLSQFMSIRKSVMLAFLLFVGVEFIQVYLPNRSASFSDALFDTFGVLLMWGWFNFHKSLISVRS